MKTFKELLHESKGPGKTLRNILEVDEGPLSKRTRSAEECASKHGVSVSFIKAQLKMGIRVEREHTRSDAVAREIALDHLWEMPDYYSRLRKMEEAQTPWKGVNDVLEQMPPRKKFDKKKFKKDVRRVMGFQKFLDSKMNEETLFEVGGPSFQDRRDHKEWLRLDAESDEHGIHSAEHMDMARRYKGTEAEKHHLALASWHHKKMIELANKSDRHLKGARRVDNWKKGRPLDHPPTAQFTQELD